MAREGKSESFATGGGGWSLKSKGEGGGACEVKRAQGCSHLAPPLLLLILAELCLGAVLCVNTWECEAVKVR